MKKQDIEKFINTNNLLIEIVRNINKQFIATEKELIEQYRSKYGKDAFYGVSINYYNNPFDYADYICLMSEKYDDGMMYLDNNSVVILGYEESRDFGIEKYEFYVDIDLIENYENKNYLNERITQKATAKIESEYQKSKKILEDKLKKAKELELLKKDKDYQLYLELKKKYGENFEILLRR